MNNRILNNFFDLTKPCNFPGCESLRKKYLHEKNSSGCSGCKKAALLRKYTQIIKNRFEINTYERKN